MPVWLLSLLQIFAPLVVKWALAFLDKKNPGIAAEIQKIIDFLNGHPNPQSAIKDLKVAVSALRISPDAGQLKKV